MSVQRHPSMLVGPVAVLVTVFVVGEFVTDDAMITLRYARNFAEGHGLVWNPDGPRVEGYSNFSHVLLGALALRLGLAPLATLQLVNLSALVALSVLVHRVTDGATGSKLAAGAAAAACGLHASHAYWGTSGLETASYSFLVLLFVHLVTASPQRWAWIAASYGLALITRPEAPVLLVVASGVVVGLVVLRKLEGSWRGHWRWVLLCAVLTAVYFAWRYAYFGHWMPNSAYYKSMVRGEPVLVRAFVFDERWMLWGLLFVPWWRMERLPLTLLGLVAAYVVGYWGVRPSVAYFHRFFLPVHAPLAVLGGLGLAHWFINERPRGVPLLAAWLAAVVWVSGQRLDARNHPVRMAYNNDKITTRHVTRAQVAAVLAEHASPGHRAVIGDAGLIGYFTKLHLVDGFGLNDTRYTHQHQGDLEAYIETYMAESPDWVILLSREAGRFRPVYPADRYARAVEGFSERYERVWVARSPNENYHYWIHAKRSLGIESADPGGSPLDLDGWDALALDRAAKQNYASP